MGKNIKNGILLCGTMAVIGALILTGCSSNASPKTQYKMPLESERENYSTIYVKPEKQIQLARERHILSENEVNKLTALSRINHSKTEKASKKLVEGLAKPYELDQPQSNAHKQAVIEQQAREQEIFTRQTAQEKLQLASENYYIDYTSSNATPIKY